MQFKKLPLFLLSAVLLSGCTKGCEGEKQNAPTPPTAPAAPKSESSMTPEQQTDVAANTADATDAANDNASEE